MKNLTAKYLSLLLLAASLDGTLQAGHQDGDYVNGDCCARQYECGCNPLYCGAWDLQIQAGVLPIIWRDRGNFSVVEFIEEDPLNSLFDVPKFSTFFKLPWTVGFQCGYALSDNVRAYLEFNYSQAKGKNAVSLNNGAPSPFPEIPQITVVFNNGNYKLFDMYVGGRYYFDRWCQNVSFFLGAKAGFVHHSRVKFSSTIRRQEADEIPAIFIPFTNDLDLFKRNTVPSVGIDFGFDLCYCGNWSLVFASGVLASCGPSGNSNIMLNQSDFVFSNLLIGNAGIELRFPVTLAVRYSF